MYKHILFPYDGSELSRKAESECIGLAKILGASVTVMNVEPHPDLHRVRGPLPVQMQRLATAELDTAAETEGRSMLSEVQTRARASGVKCNMALARGGEPYKAIIEHAEKSGCDLIIMASRRRGPLDAVVHGSQAMRVLSHCRIPLLVVRAQ